MSHRALAFAVSLAGVVAVSCTKTVRMVPREDLSVLADTTRTFEIHTKDGNQFVSKKATVSDSVLVVKKGYQVQTDPWRQKSLASVPIQIPMSDIDTVSQIEIGQDRTLAVVLITLGVVLGVAILLGMGGLYGGGS